MRPTPASAALSEQDYWHRAIIFTVSYTRQPENGVYLSAHHLQTSMRMAPAWHHSEDCASLMHAYDTLHRWRCFVANQALCRQPVAWPREGCIRAGAPGTYHTAAYTNRERYPGFWPAGGFSSREQKEDSSDRVKMALWVPWKFGLHTPRKLAKIG